MSILQIQEGMAVTGTELQQLVSMATTSSGVHRLMAQITRRAGLLPNPTNGRVEDKGRVTITSHQFSDNTWRLRLGIEGFSCVFRSDDTESAYLSVLKHLPFTDRGFDVAIPDLPGDVHVAVVAFLTAGTYEDPVFIIGDDGAVVSEEAGDIGFLLRSGSDSVPQNISIDNESVRYSGEGDEYGAFTVRSVSYDETGRYRITLVPGGRKIPAGTRVVISIHGTYVGSPVSRSLYIRDFVNISVVAAAGSQILLPDASFSLTDLANPQAKLLTAFPIHYFRVQREGIGGVTKLQIIEDRDVRQENTTSFFCTPQKVFGEFTGSSLSVYSDVLDEIQFTISGSLKFENITSATTGVLYPLATSQFDASEFASVNRAVYIPVTIRHLGEVTPTVLNNASPPVSITNPILPSFAGLLKIEKGTGRNFVFSIEDTSYSDSVVDTSAEYEVLLTQTSLTEGDFII